MLEVELLGRSAGPAGAAEWGAALDAQAERRQLGVGLRLTHEVGPACRERHGAGVHKTGVG